MGALSMGLWEGQGVHKRKQVRVGHQRVTYLDQRSEARMDELERSEK